MKYFEIFFLGIVVFLTNLPNPYAFEFQNENVDLIIRPGIGFRIDDLKWSIADLDGHPNILVTFKSDRICDGFVKSTACSLCDHFWDS